MRKLIICDKNKVLTDAVKKMVDSYGKGVFDSVEVVHGDVIKVHEANPGSKIVTASNPQFSPDGGLDAILAKKYGWDNPQEFNWNDHLFFVKSVDKSRNSSKEILLRAAVGILAYSTKHTLILTGLGTGVGGLALDVFVEIVRSIISNLREADLWEADLREADLREANLRGADLQGANLREADLWGANLWEANLRGADLREANLRGANLWGADLWGANLWGANLRGAKNLPEKFHDALNVLRFQIGKLRAFKYVTEELKSPQQSGFQYKVGKTFTEKDFDKSDLVLCSSGLNVASLEWCIRERNSNEPIIEVEFAAKDIVSIPYNTDGKFRVKKLKVLRKLSEKDIKKLLKKTRNYD